MNPDIPFLDEPPQGCMPLTVDIWIKDTEIINSIWSTLGQAKDAFATRNGDRIVFWRKGFKGFRPKKEDKNGFDDRKHSGQHDHVSNLG